MATCEANDKNSLASTENDPTTSVTKTCQLNDIQHQTMEVNIATINSVGKYEGNANNDALMKMPAALIGRERKIISPTLCILNDGYVDPQSPSSSSSTSQTTNDATFEPTIEMMVNDFDDEQTLNEEEALASLESQDPDDEINTLKKESEMPLEELLAKYRDLPPLPPSSLYAEPLRKKAKKTSRKEKHKQKKIELQSAQTNQSHVSINIDPAIHDKGNVETFETEDGDEIVTLPDNKMVNDANEKCPSTTLSLRKPLSPSMIKERKEINSNLMLHSEIPKVRRSHLLDLYPEGTFDNVMVASDAISGSSKETLFTAEDDEEDEEIEEEDDEDYKKKVMIGASYQATIPVGLSQYGDVLPYENEDKLIWEPCQVSEREVEEYLIKIRDIKSNQQSAEEDKLSSAELNSESLSKENGRSDDKTEDLENNSFLANGDNSFVETAATMEMDSQTVVKDNEQALHLLVQCGYDFKEALRRKRLNALPLNDCMSLWSEEECHKFEEGIQKYGKDFLKIRQNQVRTRTMRELVQFYYLWKKSERRDHNFANADTVDHMDIYLNEDNDYGSNPSAILTPVGSPDGNTTGYTTGSGRNGNFSQKNISIMTTTTSTVQTAPHLTLEKNGSNTCLQQQHHHHHQHQQPQQHHKKRTHNCNQVVVNTTTTSTSDLSSESLTANTLLNSAK